MLLFLHRQHNDHCSSHTLFAENFQGAADLHFCFFGNTLSNKVYMVKLKDGTYAAVRLTNYMNASGVKGFMTIDYIYPFEL